MFLDWLYCHWNSLLLSIYQLILFGNFIRFGNSAWDFFTVNFCSRDIIFWVVLEALGIFFGFDFYPHSIIPITWHQEYPLGMHSTTRYNRHLFWAYVMHQALPWVSWVHQSLLAFRCYYKISTVVQVCLPQLPKDKMYKLLWQTIKGAVSQGFGIISKAQKCFWIKKNSKIMV